MMAIDGKTLRRSHARAKGRGPLHTLSAWAKRRGLMLEQEAVAEKSNEITAIPRLIQRLELTGALVTIDAMGTRTEAVIKHTALNMLSQAKPTTSLKNRRNRAGWNADHLAAVIQGNGQDIHSNPLEGQGGTIDLFRRGD